MSEIERAIELFEDEVRILYGHGNLSSPEIIDAHELALKLLRAELSRQENAPLTWNERINQMTARQKSDFAPTFAHVVERARRYANKNCRNRMWNAESVMSVYVEKWLNSPYTEGEKV